MTQCYWPGGCRKCGMATRKSPRSPGPFLVVSHHTILDARSNPLHTSCAPWPAGQLGVGRLRYRRVCICVAHDKQGISPATRSSWYLFCGNIFSILVLWRSESGLHFLYFCSGRNSSKGPPLLSPTSPPRPRFCAEDLPKPCWSTLRIEQPSTCY